MYLLGHIGVTLFISVLFQRFRHKDYSKYSLYLGIGSMFPDMIDKPIGSIIFETGRWLGHSILFLTTLLFLSRYLSRGKQFHKLDLPSIFQVTYIGSLIHLIEDFGISKTVIFWPIFGSFPSGARGDFLQGFKNPFTVTFEIIGLILLIITGVNDRWEKRSWGILSGIIIIYLLLFITTYGLIVGF